MDHYSFLKGVDDLITSMYTIIWKYVVKPGHQDAFELAYGTGGSWASFFARSQDYLGSELYRCLSHSTEYIVTDRWVSQQAYDQFLHDHAQHYKELSHRFEFLYIKEEKLGSHKAPRTAWR